MKKFSLYILVTIIAINLLLPFSISLNGGKLIQGEVANAIDNCIISSAGWNPSGEQADKFYKEGETTANINVKSKNCVGVPGINLTIYESDGITTITDDVWDDSGLDDRTINIPSDNFTIRILLGEEDCETIAGGGIGFDCDLYFKLKNGSDVIYSSVDAGSSGDGSNGNNSGWLWYGCDGLTCDTNGRLLEIIPQGDNDNPVNIEGSNPVNLDNSYKLLAPIGNLTKAPDNMGDYFRIIFELAIGLCAVLAVIMIVIGGVQYMGNESIFGKTEAKSKIFAAVGGLLIALGAYALLNTINPDLLGGKGVTVDQVSAEIVPLYDRGANDPKKANGESIRCTPVLSGPCSVSNLTTIFGADNAVAMSKICNMESGGTSAISGTDICKPGDNAFSFGLFQVNLSANGILAGSDCVGLFDRAVRGSDAIEPKYNSGFNCKLLSGKETMYNTCKNRLLDTTTNLAIAKKLFTPDKKAWLGDKKYCASAFN